MNKMQVSPLVIHTECGELKLTVVDPDSVLLKGRILFQRKPSRVALRLKKIDGEWTSDTAKQGLAKLLVGVFTAWEKDHRQFFKMAAHLENFSSPATSPPSLRTGSQR